MCDLSEGGTGMLVFSRKTNECIVIDGNIEVMVVSIQSDCVKLGIQAPKSIPVNRSEVQQRIAANLARSLMPGKKDLTPQSTSS
jgi:carbon storage regulator